MQFKLESIYNNYNYCITGQYTVYIADPSAVEKVFRNEGKYPVRTHIDENADWIMKRRKGPRSFSFQ